jgi:hypothetical protein
LFPTDVPGFVINVKTITGWRFKIYVKPEDKIETIKLKVHEDLGHPVHLQQLWYKKTLLDSNKCVSDYPIKKGSTLTMKLVLPSS